MKWKQLNRKQQLLESKTLKNKSFILNLEQWFRVELTYTSNALEGNTLTRQETALIIEKDIATGGKSLMEHLEAKNHAKALDYIAEFKDKPLQDFNEQKLLAIHEIILTGIDTQNAGRYRNTAVRISGSTVILPNPRKVAELMEGFIKWLRSTSELHPAALASEAHYRLVSIHPFTDGNGRTARILMNLILMIHGFPPAIIRPKDRLKYLNALEAAQTGSSKTAYEQIIFEAVERSLDIYLNTMDGSNLQEQSEKNSFKKIRIGQLAKEAGVTVATIRYWTKENLLEVAEFSKSGYSFYSSHMIKRCQKIQKLKSKRKTLAEIRQHLESK